MIDRAIIEAIRTRVRLDELASETTELRPCGHDDFRGLCPFHNERSPSFHVHPEKGFFKCFGCGQGGDVIDFISRKHAVPFHEAVTWLANRIGITTETTDLPAYQSPPRRIETRSPSETWIRLQATLRPGTITELFALAELRQLPSIAGLQLATDLRQLLFGPVFDDGFDWPCWIITDSSRRNAQARRLDGKPFSGIGNKKAKTIAGCEANWPVGVTDINNHDVALVEGGPDFLAAWHALWFLDRTRQIRPVAMFGASNRIHAEALPHFTNKTVHIFPHSDDNLAGQRAAEVWAEQLRPLDTRVTFFDFSKHGVKDLNDLATRAASHAEGAT